MTERAAKRLIPLLALVALALLPVSAVFAVWMMEREKGRLR